VTKTKELPRREFLKQAAGAVGVAARLSEASLAAESPTANNRAQTAKTFLRSEITYPRVFQGNQLKMIAFPLGGLGAGSLRLGGRGQLRDWEIFNRPSKGLSPRYAFPAIWARAGNAEPVARVLEARILPPYEGEDGLGSDNVPGLSRLASAKFTGEYPLAHIDFKDPALPVSVSLDAFSPFIPHDAENSGLPVGMLRYRIRNPGRSSAQVGLVFSIDNPVRPTYKPGEPAPGTDQRQNEFETSDRLIGLVMSNPGLPNDDPMQGTFVLATKPENNVEVTQWRGWPQGRWWNSPMLFWDVFSKDGRLGTEPNPRSSVGALCQKATIAPGESASFVFLLAWHFPNRTPDWCGWTAPEGEGKAIIGNYYSTRFKNAWEAAEYTANHLEKLEAKTHQFAEALRQSTLPAVAKEAASANLSVLASTTCFRTADGEFHGFEGSDNDTGCCFGNCTHVWNYETATTYLFPSFARSLRKAAFGYSMDDAGAMHFRQLLPEGKARSGFAAADGQMGQIIHAYLDWRASGDTNWLRALWPRVKKGLEFAWVPGGWDANRDGVVEGVQHNTYDVEFYGPNPLCGIYYLGALRARAVGDGSAAGEYKRLFTQGRHWIDSNLFNGEFFVQQIRGFHLDQIAPNLRSEMGSEDTENPQYQLGKGCLVDQLLGQYLAEVGSLGALVAEDHILATLRSIYKYNYKRTMVEHDNVERTFVLNDEASMVICDYGQVPRPRIPFPYYAETMTGFEYSTAALMIYSGMVDQGLECIHNIRARYDGEKRNPWDEAECGHHYARAMASWTSVLALSGFDYDGAKAAVVAVPRVPHTHFKSFWATATGWGRFSYSPGPKGETVFNILVLSGNLPCRSCEISAEGRTAFVAVNKRSQLHTLQQRRGRVSVCLAPASVLLEGDQLEIRVAA
jgi:uncharacterized protein (DUF608 family)